MTHKQTYRLPADWDRAVTAWLDHLRAGGTPATTLRTRRGHVRAIARRLRTDSPAETNGDQLVALFARADWSTEHRRGLRASLLKFFDHYGGDNPARALPKVREAQPMPRPAPETVWKRALVAAGPRETVMIRLAAEAGLRRGEVARVHTDDLVDAAGGRALRVHGKGDRQRIVPITDELAALVAAGPGGHDPARGRRGYLFPGQIGGHLSADRVGVLVAELLPEGWSMHKLRHRFATRAYAGTRDIRAVQTALGHVSVATTQRYTAVADDAVRAAVAAAAA